MRVLVTCVPQTGHFAPLVSFAEVLAAQGDEVVVASGDDAAEAVGARGLAFQRAGGRFSDWFAALAARTRGKPGDGLAPERVEGYFVPRLFGEIGTSVTIDELIAIGREFAPELVVYDPYMFAGPLVARLLGARQVLHTLGPVMDPTVVELAADAVSPIWREFDLDVPRDAGLYGGTTLTVCPPALDSAGAALPGARPLRPTALPRGGSPPAELPGDVWDRPVVYVTLGTFSNTNLALFRLLIDSVCSLPVNVVVTTGRDVDPADLGGLPAQVHARPFMPQEQLLPHCAAVVHHAGAGTIFGVLAHALPSVAVPRARTTSLLPPGSAPRAPPRCSCRTRSLRAPSPLLLPRSSAMTGTGRRRSSSPLRLQACRRPNTSQPPYATLGDRRPRASPAVRTRCRPRRDLPGSVHAATPRWAPSRIGRGLEMSATLRLTHKAIGVEVRRGTYDSCG